MFNSPICRNHETSSRNLDKIRPRTQFIRTHKRYGVSRAIPLQPSLMSPPLESRITKWQSCRRGSAASYPLGCTRQQRSSLAASGDLKMSPKQPSLELT
jgi:hypothetical protein